MADRRYGVRVRTTAGATLVVGVALAVGGVALVLLLQRSLTRDIQTAAELRAQDVVALLDAGRPPALLAVDNAEESLVQVVDRSGTVVASSINIADTAPIGDLRPGEARTVRGLPIGDERSYRVVARGTADGQYIVLVARTLDPVDESGAALAGALAIGLPVLLLLVAFTTWTVTGRALRPVEAIRREVAAISDAELGRRVPEPGGRDEVARLARTMNTMLDRLQRSRDRQRQFISDASHELRSPIASIRHQLETALAHPQETGGDKLAAGLLAEDMRMERLVNALLLLARADENIITPSRRPVDVDDLVLAEAARLRRRGRVAVDTTAVSASRIDGDPAQLASMVHNLADNAERHAASTVRLAVAAIRGWLTLTVSDDGNGVPAADRERIFERFTRLDDARARDTGGAGLGLAIVAEVARAHGGTVRVEDGPGARFVVVLPTADGFSVD
ncbi:MAG TPA: HAMP domain-containing sensor histidine kinase [Pseudonocardiaceae bacterium]